jgi:catechol 2,3-dioxygenase-like lactoylglutathione lyase family enzyme
MTGEVDRWGLVSKLSHVAFSVPDLDASVAHAKDTLGLREVSRQGQTVYLTCTEAHHALQLIGSDRAECHHTAFQVASLGALEELAGALAHEGVKTVEVQAGEEEGIAGALRFTGPSGHDFELLVSMEGGQPERYNTAGIRTRRLEHVGYTCPNVEEAVQFFVRVLGFRVSDRMAVDAYVWMRCDLYHHSIGFIKGETGFHHHAWEVLDFSDYRRLGDHLRANGETLLWGIGRHGPGHNIFAYFLDPAGAVVEYSGDLQRIEDEATYVAGDWPHGPSTGTVWGSPAPPLNEFLALGMKQPDRRLVAR